MTVLGTVKLIISHIVKFISYIFCRKKRRRKISANDVPLSGVEVIPSKDSQNTVQWESWEDSMYKPNTVDEHIQLYRKQQQQYLLRNPSQETEEENPIELFKDMEPQITRQPKLILKHSQIKDKSDINSKMFTYDALPAKENELGTWDDENSWDTGDCDNEAIRKEIRRLEREKRAVENAKKKVEKERIKLQKENFTIQ